MQLKRDGCILLHIDREAGGNPRQPNTGSDWKCEAQSRGCGRCSGYGDIWRTSPNAVVEDEADEVIDPEPEITGREYATSISLDSSVEALLIGESTTNKVENSDIDAENQLSRREFGKPILSELTEFGVIKE